MTDRIALYGGSFDPIHNGHLIVARSVAESFAMDRVVFLPAAAPPHKGAQSLSHPRHRSEMVRLAIHGDPLFSLSDYDMRRAGPHYSIDTVFHFRKELAPDVELCWIIGADSLAELATWHRVAEIVQACRIVTAARPGWSDGPWDSLRTVLDEAAIRTLKTNVIKTPLIEISSTDVRHRIRTGRSIAYLVPECVASYIQKHGLYCGS